MTFYISIQREINGLNIQRIFFLVEKPTYSDKIKIYITYEKLVPFFNPPPILDFVGGKWEKNSNHVLPNLTQLITAYGKHSNIFTSILICLAIRRPW